MKTLIAAIALTVSAGAASAQMAMPPMMQASMACNEAYRACLAGGDMAMATTPAEGMAKMQANMSNAASCNQQYMMCGQQAMMAK